VQPSPYTPGEVARQVPGRGTQLLDMDERLSYMIDLHRLVGRVRVDVAPRGLGKTSLLRQAQRHADGRGALTIWVTAGEELGLITSIGEEIRRRTETWASETRGRLGHLLENLQLTLGVPGVAQVKATVNTTEPAGAGAPVRGVREFELLIRETVRGALAEDRRGVVLFVDEIQAADQVVVLHRGKVLSNGTAGDLAGGQRDVRGLAKAFLSMTAEGREVPA